jgi:NADH-quinone oxidoreductase subunit N
MIDGFGVFFKTILMLFLGLVIVLTTVGQSMTRKDESSCGSPTGPEFFILLLVSALGMMLMVSSTNLLVIIIAIEMASQPSYAMVAGNKRSRRAAEASLKYVTFGAVASGVMIYGISLLYGRFQTTDLSAMGIALADSQSLDLIATIGFVAMGAGLAFKIAAVPFHFWCPDVFEGAPVEVTTWLSVASKAAGLGLLLRIVQALSQPAETADLLTPLALLVGTVASITCTVGNLAAMRQTSVKRILAYSSIAHAGYMMMAGAIIAAGNDATNAHPAFTALAAYLLVYLIMNLGAFGVTAFVTWQCGTDDLSAFKGLGRRAPLLALPMTICLFSLVGLPPLAGFAAKWWLLFALGQAAGTQPWLWTLVIVAVANTAISLYYYVAIIRQMYLTDDREQEVIRAPFVGVALVNVCAVALILLGTIFFNPLSQSARRFSTNLHVQAAATAGETS